MSPQRSRKLQVVLNRNRFKGCGASDEFFLGTSFLAVKKEVLHKYFIKTPGN